jgi:ERCC4-type nuclease
MKPIITVDTRETGTDNWADRFTCPVQYQKLDTGDYSILGCEHFVGVERKSLDDFAQCLSYARDRFERQLRRGRTFDGFWVIVEGKLSDLLQGKYRSNVEPGKAFDSVAGLTARHGIPILFAETAEIGARLCESLFLKWWGDRARPYELMQRSTQGNLTGSRVA